MLSITPQQAFFKPGEPIRLKITATYPAVEIAVFHLDAPVATWTVTTNGGIAETEYRLAAQPGCGYLVRARAGGDEAFTAFDVLDRWTQAPRYGFLDDFKPDRAEVNETLDHLLALHINGLQFYDWQYRHDTLLPPQDAFTDPLGRPLSLATVRQLIDAAHRRGMAAMPYTAIYAASPAFAADHPSWLLYDAQHQPIDFAGGFLKITNPCGPWQAHFVAECRRVLETLPFDGIHVDQYGEPTSGFDASGEPVDLAEGFVETLAALRGAVGSEKAVLFNLVHNWPVDATASSPLDFWYSELWPPDTRLTRLWQTIRDNRRLNDRPAVLAVYIPPTWEQTVIAAHSTILAAGGQHIAHGDHGRYLSDPYFPKAQAPSPTLARRLQQLADFAVAYEEAMQFAADVTDEWSQIVSVPGMAKPLVVVRAAANRLFIQVLNTAGNWDAELPLPAPIDGAVLETPRPWKAAWTATPTSPVPQPLAGRTLPTVTDWLLVCLEFEGNPA